MARPCKADAEQDGRRRLRTAFWALLETHELRDLSVSMVVTQAGCNRGTFYYHFHDMEGLIRNAIEEDLITGRHTIADALFGIATGNNDWIAQGDLAQQFAHLCLIMEKGGMKLVDETVKQAVFCLWRAVLCPDGSSLTIETEMILHFHASGILGVLMYLSTKGSSFKIESLCDEPYLAQSSELLLRQLSDAQGVPVDEITARLSTAARVVKLSA